MRLKGFGEDVTITHVGLLLRKAASDNARNHSWLLDVKGYPIQEKKTTLLSNLPALVRGHRLNATREYDLKPNLHLKIGPIARFEEVPLSGYAGRLYPKSKYIDERESALWGYRTYFNGIEIIFPQLEMARALFLNTAHLARQCMGTTFIDLEFEHQLDGSGQNLNIHLTKANHFSVQVLDERQIRQQLSWLLFREDALSSYQSIYRHYVKERFVDQGWEKWQFRFDLPDLSGWEMALRGRYLERNKKQFFVEEVMRLQNAVQMPRKVTFTGEMFKETKFVQGPKINVQEGDDEPGGEVGQNMAPPTETTELSDDVGPNDQATPVIFTLRSEGMHFIHPFDTSIESNRTVKRSDGTLGEKNVERPNSKAETADTKGSTSEATIYGDARSAEMITEGLDDSANETGEDDSDVQSEGTFSAFDQMVRFLCARYKWEKDEEFEIELEKVGRSRLHCLKGTKRPRRMKVYRLSKATEDKPFFVRLVEIDTTDGVKALSTKILQFDTVKKWHGILKELRELIVKKSITWPNDIFEKTYENTLKSLVHPQCVNSTINNLSQEEIERWAERAELEMSTVKVENGEKKNGQEKKV